MALNPFDIDRIINLARMKLNAKEKYKFLIDLNKLLEHMEIIDNIEAEIEEKPAFKKQRSRSPKPNIVKSD